MSGYSFVVAISLKRLQNKIQCQGEIDQYTLSEPITLRYQPLDKCSTTERERKNSEQP